MLEKKTNALLSKTAGLTFSEEDFPPPVKSSTDTKFPAVGTFQPKTAPGHLMAFGNEVKSLKAKLDRFTDSMPTKKIDCSEIVESRFANRHQSSFETTSFIKLKDDIEHAGGNVQPILVHTLEDKEFKYRIVYGHRRLKACKLLGMQVLTCIYDGVMTDREVFASMERENRGRENLTIYEQGQMYRLALQEGLYPSVRRLSEDLGISHTWVNKALTVANIPASLIDCFASPNQIRYNHAVMINEALKTDPVGVIKRAESISNQDLPTTEVVATLANKKDVAQDKASTSLAFKDKVFGSIEYGKKGILIKLDSEEISQEKAIGLQSLITDYLSK